MAEKQSFDPDLITGYPKSKKKVNLQIRRFSVLNELTEDKKSKAQSIHISPYGLEFHVPDEFVDGTLLKIDVSLPNYWTRKQSFVDYARIDTPKTFKILAKVVRTEDVGKRGKKKLVTAQTLNIDEVDEKVLREFLKEGK